MSNGHPLKGKKVLFVLCGFDLGGAERQALHLARYLKGLDSEVRVWGHHHRYRGPELVIDSCKAAGIPWAEYKFRWPCGKLALICDAWRLLFGLWRERPDVILSYTTWPNVGCGLVWSWSPAKVFIWGQRDLAPLKNNWIVRLAYRRASTIICNAAHEINHLSRSIGETKVPIHVVHNGIKLASPKLTRSQWRQNLDIPEDAFVATMLANLRTDKDYLTLLHSWRKVLDTSSTINIPRLILAGALQEASFDVQKIISGLSLSDSVILTGQINDVAGFLSSCDIGILSTRAEGLPNAILEYMTCGLPVIATDIPGNREALGDNFDEQLYIPGDAENLAVKLHELIRFQKLRNKLGINNQIRAKKKFPILKMCERMTSIIVQMLAQVPYCRQSTPHFLQLRD